MAPTSGACAQITVFIDPEKVDEFFKMFDAMLPKLKARPELLFFAVFTSPEEPGKITWIEQW